MTAPDVVVVGASNLDLCFRAPRLPQPGETVGDAELTEGFGGKGANQAVAAARFGATTSFVSSLGQDEAGTAFSRLLEAEGIDASGCRFHAGRRTGRACVWVDGDGENQILVDPGANAFLEESAVAGALAEKPAASIVLCQLETPIEGVAAAVEWAREVGARSVVNAAPAAPLDRLRVAPDVLVANEHEAKQLAPGVDPEPRRLAAALADQLRVGLVAITLGAEGAVLWDAGSEHAVPAPRVAPVDTTGAGDAFCGALAARLAAGEDPARATRLACAAGALATLRLGAMSTLPSLAGVEATLAAHGPG